MSDIATQKQRQRRQSIQIRKICHSQESEEQAADALCRFVVSFRLSSVVAGFSPIRSEISPMKALEELGSLGYSLCLPVVTAKQCPLRFKAWTFGASLVRGEHDILVPESGGWIVPNVAIVPLLAFDSRGYRLGYGGGYYDRTIAALKADNELIAVGLAFSGQEIAVVPTNDTDHKLDAIVTECGVRHFTTID